MAIKAKLLPRWPAAIDGVAPIVATKANGAVTLSYDSSGLQQASTPPDGAKVVVRSGDIYQEVPTSNFVQDVASVKDFGAVGDGATNDTVALQAALQASVTSNISIFVPSGIYMADNLTIPYDSAWDVNGVPYGQKMVRLIGEPGAVIRKRSSADNSYLIAGERWILLFGGVAYAQGPFIIENICFDGNSIAQDVFVSVNWGFTLDSVEIMNGTRYGFFETVTNKTGISVLGNRAKGEVINCRIHDNITTGWKVDYASTAFITDRQFSDNFIWDNGQNINWAQAAGWKSGGGNHMWNYNRQPTNSSTPSVYIGNSTALTIDGGDIFEGYEPDIVPAAPFRTYGLEIGGEGAAIVVNGCRFIGGLGINFTFTGGSTLAHLSNSSFLYTLCALRHGSNNNTHEVISSGNTFQAAVPYTWSAGAAHNGIITALNDRIVGIQRIITGRQRPDGVLVGEIPSGFVYKTIASPNVNVRDPHEIWFTEVMASDVPCLLPANPYAGQSYTIVRGSSCTGAGILKIKNAASGDIVYLSAAGNGARVVFDGAAWRTAQIAAAQS